MRSPIPAMSLCAMIACAGCGNKESIEQIPIPVKVETVQATDVRPILRYSGEIKPDTQVDLAFKQGGYVTALYQVRGADGRARDVQIGDSVPAGAILAVLRQKDFEAPLTEAAGQETSARGSLAASQADLDQAMAKQKQADADFQRAEALYAAKAMTRPDYDAAVANHTSAVAQVQSAMEQIKARQGQLAFAEGQASLARIALQDASLTTPIPSIIVQKKIERGALVGSGTVGFTIADARVAKVAFGVPDGMLSQFKMGERVRVDVDALRGREFTGRITTIAASAGRESRVFTIEVSLPNSDHALKVGMIATVHIEQASAAQKVPMIPVTALITTQSGSTNYSVFVILDQGSKQIAKLKSVRIGETLGDTVAIEEGLVPGEKIITNLTNQLTDGATVRVTN